MLGLGDRSQIGFGLLRKLSRIAIQADRGCDRWQFLAQGLLGNQHLYTCQLLVQAISGIVGIERNVGAAGFENS